jgi:cytochrome c-type biogenesis protein CcmH/NrfG
MSRIYELVGLACSAVICLTAVIGGFFFPLPRTGIGVVLVVLVGAGILVMRRPRVEEWMLLPPLLWGVISAVLVGSSPLRAKEVLSAWLVTWLLWLTVRRLEESTRQAVQLSLIAAGAILSIGVMAECLGRGATKVGGLLESSNVAAALLVPTMVVAVARLRSWRPVWLLAFCLGLLGLGLVLTGSRAGLLAAVLAVVVMLPNRRQQLLASGFGGLALVALLVWRYTTHTEPLAWHRLSIWKALLQLSADHPVLGVSPGALPAWAGQVRISYPESLMHHPYLITHAESTPIGALVQIGSVGALLLAIGLVFWIRWLWSESQLSAPQLGGALVAMAVFATFHDLLEIEIVLWWWALLIGSMETIPGSTVVSRPTWARAITALGLCGLLLWGLVQPAYAALRWVSAGSSEELAEQVMRIEPWLAEPAQWVSLEYLSRDSWTWSDAAAAIVWSQRAVAAQPDNAASLNRMAQIHSRVVNELGYSPQLLSVAGRAFERACELEPHLPWYWLGWAQLERAQGQLEHARALAQRAVSEEPSCVRGWLLLARLELDLGRIARARQALTRADEAGQHAQGVPLTRYERDLLAAPAWQWRELESLLARPR